jgi:hypothetical protein
VLLCVARARVQVEADREMGKSERAVAEAQRMLEGCPGTSTELLEVTARALEGVKVSRSKLKEEGCTPLLRCIAKLDDVRTQVGGLGGMGGGGTE